MADARRRDDFLWLSFGDDVWHSHVNSNYFIWFFDAKRLIMKRSRKVGAMIQRVAGILLVIIGVFDTVTF